MASALHVLESRDGVAEFENAGEKDKAVKRHRTMRFAILIDKTLTGFSAHVPDLPGCIAAGETREEILELIREAIALHVQGMRQHGEIVPEPTSSFEYVEVASITPW